MSECDERWEVTFGGGTNDGIGDAKICVVFAEEIHVLLGMAGAVTVPIYGVDRDGVGMRGEEGF